MDALIDREIIGAGTSESVWLPWLASQPIKTLSIDEICSDLFRLVVVAPHPDDEILMCGGLLALRAERGLPSLVVAVTNGEASHGTDDERACANLAMVRARESYCGLMALGLPETSVVRLSFPDGKAANMIFAITMKLYALLRPNDVIVTTWSLDGHPDHEAVCEAARQAALKVGCDLLEAPVWMWHWASPDELCIPWSRLISIDLPERTLLAKKQALMHHRSQLEIRDGGVDAVLVPSLVERVARQKEFYFR